LDLNDSKFNAKFVSGGYILLYDTGFYSKMSKTAVDVFKVDCSIFGSRHFLGSAIM
jgi:hypothetical protein